MTRILITAGLTAFLLATALVGGMARAESTDVLETVQGHLYAGRIAVAAALSHLAARRNVERISFATFGAEATRIYRDVVAESIA